MAERRMFAKSVIGSARFLKMPPTSRLLYYDLGMQADDDGVVEAFPVMRLTGATEDDLRVLVSKGFVCVLNEDWVTYIADWKRNIGRRNWAPLLPLGMIFRPLPGLSAEIRKRFRIWCCCSFRLVPRPAPYGPDLARPVVVMPAR